MKYAKKRKIARDIADVYKELMNRAEKARSIDLRDGDRVRLNLTSIQLHPDYKRLTKEYREFVQTHANDIFTVEFDKRHTEHPATVCFKEDPNKWLFWVGDLTKVECEQGGDSH